MWRALALVLIGCTASSQPAPVAPKVVPPPVAVVEPAKPPAPTDELPTLRLPRTFTPQSYAARLALDPAQPTFTGHIEITGELTTPSATMWLHGRHLNVTRAIADGGAVPIELHVTARGEDLLELVADAALPPGPYKLNLDYTGEIDAINTTGAFVEKSDGASYIYSQFEALYARRVFPCLDEPDSKVPWQLTLEVPKGLIAVSNTAVAHESDAGERHVFEFAQTKPLPSYLIAFGVGPFEIVPAGSTKSGVSVRIVVPKGHGASVAYAAKTSARIIDLLEARFAIPYPYPKLDFLVIPVTAGFGAMENPGLITVDSGYSDMDAKPSWRHRVTWVHGAGHELAHQWFGDLVTTAWWNDIWLNEGFANWMEQKVVADFDPAWREELDMRDQALRADSSMNARRIRQPIEVQGDILNVFDGITYNKGASILNMFEAYLGADLFQHGVTQYLKDRANGNATSADFIAALAKVSGKELAPAFATFLDQPGAPEITAALDCSASPKITLSQQRFVPAGASAPEATKPWIVPVCIAFEQDGKRAQTCTLLDAASGSVALAAKSCPRWIMPNAGGHGYFRVSYSAKQATALRDEAWPLLSNTERRAVFADIAVGATDAQTKLPLVLALSFVPKLLALDDAHALQQVSALPDLLGRYVADDQRAKLQAWYRMTFGPGATKIGMVAKDSDDFATELSRELLIETAGAAGRDPDIVKQAQALAQHWRDLPEALRQPVLEIAIDGDLDRVARALADLRSETNREHQRTLIRALAAQRDPKSYAATLPVTLDPALDLRETGEILFWSPIEATRAIAEAFYREHDTELTKRMPVDEVSSSLAAQTNLFMACDATTRDERASEVTKRFAAKPGGERVVKKAIEGMDQCIAKRASLEPEIRGWLGGVKIQKAAPPKPAEKTPPVDKKPKKAKGR